MIQFNDEERVYKRVSFVKSSKNNNKVASKKIKKKFDEVSALVETNSNESKEVEKIEKDVVVSELKIKNKDYDYTFYIKSIIDKYESELDRDVSKIENSFGKIIDWGNISVDDLVERLMDTLEALCNVRLFPYQKIFAARIFQSVLLNDGEEITALWARQSGKSECVTDVVATLMVILPVLASYFPQLKQFERGVYVGVFAPTEPQALTIAERFKLRLSSQEALNFLRDPEIDVSVDSLWMSNGSYVRIHSAAPQAKVESKTYHIIVIDEAQDVSDEKVLKSIHPMGAAVSATIVKLGTPHMKQCEFLEAINRNKRLMQVTKGKVKNHFEFDYTVVSRYNERYARWIQKEKARYGEDSDYFRMSYKLEWLLQKGMAITSDEFEKNICVKSLKLNYTPENGFSYVAGLDLGKRHDSTVLTIAKLVRRDSFLIRDNITELDEDELGSLFLESDMYYKQITAWYEWEGDNWELQIDDIVRVCKMYDTLQAISIDSTGVGDPIFEIISRRLAHRNILLIPFYFSLNNQHKLAQIFYKNLNHKNLQVPAHQSVRKTRKFNKFMLQLLDAEKVWQNDKMIIRHGTYKGAKDDYVQSMFLMLNSAEEFLNVGTPFESPNYFNSKIDDFNEDLINYSDGGFRSVSEIVGFENVRKAAREGRLIVKNATFRRIGV